MQEDTDLTAIRGELEGLAIERQKVAEEEELPNETSAMLPQLPESTDNAQNGDDHYPLDPTGELATDVAAVDKRSIYVGNVTAFKEKYSFFGF